MAACIRLVSAACAALVVFAPAAFAAQTPIVLFGADGTRQDFTLSDFDAKQLTFEVRAGKQKREVSLRGLTAIRFVPADSSSVAPPSGEWDILTMRDGGVQECTFRRIEDDKVHVKLPNGHESTFAISSVRSVCFQPKIKDVDRREFGKGFNLFGTDVEIQVAAMYGGQIESEVAVLEDPEINAYINELGQRLVDGCKRPDIPYEFRILNSGQVNAFTVGGGKIYLYRGLVEQVGSESELAGVMAHEIGHVVGRHTSRQMSKTLLMQGIVAASGELAGGEKSKFGAAIHQVGGAIAFFKTLQYSREDEREADFLSVYNLEATGIDPQGMVSAFETLQKQQATAPSKFEVFFQTHPSLEERIENTSAEITRLHREGMLQDAPSFRKMQARLLALPRPIAHLAMVADTARVPALQRRQWGWTIDPLKAPNARIVGKFRAYGGTGNDIRVLVLDEMNYVNYINGHKATALFDSGTTTTGELAVAIPEKGTYHVLLDNKFSLMTDKDVRIFLQLEYTE